MSRRSTKQRRAARWRNLKAEWLRYMRNTNGRMMLIFNTPAVACLPVTSKGAAEGISP